MFIFYDYFTSILKFTHEPLDTNDIINKNKKYTLVTNTAEFLYASYFL